MTPESLALVRQTPLLLLASIAGGGKDTVTKELLAGDDYHGIVTHTTRAPRINHDVMEQDGKDYHFITVEKAQQLLEDKKYIEAKYVHGNVYGTSAAEIQLAKDSGKIAVTDIDIQGVVEYLAVKSDTHAIFLLPPSVDTWLSRLGNRYGDLAEHEDEIHKRFVTAHTEISHILEDKRFILIVNDDLETTVARVKGVVAGTVTETSDYAEKIAEHLLDYLKTKI